jgi:hypothetical protein
MADTPESSEPSLHDLLTRSASSSAVARGIGNSIVLARRARAELGLRTNGSVLGIRVRW